jgi:tetratricopeptide (TPR) repeat protein
MWNYVPPSISRIGHESARKNPFRLEESRPHASYVPQPTLRLFRNHPEIYFEGAVHETLFHRVAALGLPSAKADIVLHHFGFIRDSEETLRKKYELYHALGESKVQADPDDVQALIELGLSYLEFHKDVAAALPYFTRAHEVTPTNAAAWLYSGVCLSRLDQPEEALVHLQRARALGVVSGVLDQAEGDAHLKKGNFAQANLAYAEIDRRGEASSLTEAKRGVAEVHLGQEDTGLSRIQRAIASSPTSAELYDILAPAALLAGRLPLAVQAMQARIAMGNLTEFHKEFVGMLQTTLTYQAVQNAG